MPITIHPISDEIGGDSLRQLDPEKALHRLPGASRCAVIVGVVRLKEIFDLRTYQSRDFEGQRKARIILASFDRVDRLTRDIEMLRQIALRPVALGANHPQSILHLFTKGDSGFQAGEEFGLRQSAECQSA
jgi:hypothetical protein